VRDDASRRFMYQLVDAFDVPVRYYRGWRTRDNNDEPTVELFPIELRSADGVEDQLDSDIARVEPERNLMTAPYALLSAGGRADRQVDENGDAFAPFGDVVLNESGQRTNLQADASGVFQDQSGSPEDLGALDRDEVKSLLSFLKSNIRYVP
jgi:hypothetical protein